MISLPSGGGAVSGLGETFCPDLFTGTGNFSVPIALPPGRCVTTTPDGRVFTWKITEAAEHVLTRRTPVGRKVMPHVRFHGAPMLRVKRADLERRGVERAEQRLVGVCDGLPQLGDGTAIDVRNVIWRTGFRHAFDWIHLPVVRSDGWPEEMRGSCRPHRGCYFCGLAFQHALSSMVLPGIGRDAGFVARHIATRAHHAATVTAPARAACRSYSASGSSARWAWWTISFGLGEPMSRATGRRRSRFDPRWTTRCSPMRTLFRGGFH